MEEEGYAKLEGMDVETNNAVKVYIKKERVVLGRNKKDPESDYIALGECKTVSRKHAILTWNPSVKMWTLDVKGKNGMTVDGVEVPVNGKANLKNVSALR